MSDNVIGLDGTKRTVERRLTATDAQTLFDQLHGAGFDASLNTDHEVSVELKGFDARRLRKIADLADAYGADLKVRPWGEAVFS